MLKFAALVVAASLSAPAFAGIAFENPFVSPSGSCAFNTTCGSRLTGNTFAAQRFTLATTRTLIGGTLDTLTAADPGSVNWQILAANTTTGLPGSLLYSGNAPIHYYRPWLGNYAGLIILREAYDLPPMPLAAGTYYLGLQYVTPTFNVFMGLASAFDGAAQSNDGGATWTSGYGGDTGIAVTLYDTSWSGPVPEPASWAMMIGGFGMVGAQLRRRRVVAA